MDIIKESTFLTLTTCHNSKPWACPLFYTTNEMANNIPLGSGIQLFFVSSINSKHVKNIMINPQVSITIFNSNQVEGNAQGVQIKGECYIVPREEYADVIKFFTKKLNQDINEDTINRFDGTPRKIFRIIVHKIYIQDQDYWKKNRIDKRIKIYDHRENQK
jgi:uncharacterized protein YhbP (UPF0306 family)